MMTADLPSIAVVDDDESVLRALRRLLKAGGMNPSTFQSGADFLDSTANSDFACVLLDIWMPELDGFEVARLLAAKSKCIPLIFMSAHDNESNRRNAADCGASNFLAKPISEKQLFAAIRKALAYGRGGDKPSID